MRFLLVNKPFSNPLVSFRCFRSNISRLRYASSIPSSDGSQYDVAIIGGGPGGYVSAIKAAQLGLKTVCIEKRGTLGGTCLNVGCIPSKSLLNITHKYQDARDNFQKLGIKVDNCQLDMDQMQKKKDQIIKGLTGGIEMLFKMNKVDYKKGIASFLSSDTLKVVGKDGTTEQVKAKNIVIATGSESSSMPTSVLNVDEKSILTSTGLLALKEVPRRLVVIGGGVIGLELGSVFNRLTSQVTVIEYLDRLVPGLDGEVANSIQKLLTKQGMQFKLSTKVVKAVEQNGQIVVTLECAKTGKQTIIECDKVLVAVGRRPYTSALGLEAINVETEKRGFIPVNDNFQVKNYSNIFAIGDCIRGAMLAHKAEEEGIAVAEIMANKSGHVNYETIPSVIYTHPEVAGVGKTEEELKTSGVQYSKGVFSFASNSRARVNDDVDGFVKILAEKSTDRLLGGWIVGPQAGELIQSLILALEYGASSEDIARTCHAHPTLSEAIKEACLSTHSKPIHGSKK